jgi:ADP-heptose:LPS heptosyltransferase
MAAKHPPDDAECRRTFREFAAGRYWRFMPKGMRRRWWLFRPLDFIARHWPVAGKKQGVLVVRMDGIGDMVLFRGALDYYAEALGVEKSAITVLGCDAWKDIAGEIFDGFRIVTINEHKFAKNPFYRFRVARMVRRLNAAIAVNDGYFRRALMADSLAHLSAAPSVISSRPYVSAKTRSEYTWYMSQAANVIDTGPYPIHEIQRHFNFVGALAGRAIAPVPPKISWRDAKPPIPAGDPYIVINLGSNEPGRRWPGAHAAAIFERVLESGHRLVLIGSENQRPDKEILVPFRDRNGFIDLIGKTSLSELLDLLKSAAAVLSNDSGPAHLSIALGAPTVVIVGGGHFGCFVPYPEAVRPATARFVFERMDCYHCFWACHKRQNRVDAFPCVAAVSVDAVWNEMRVLLHNRNEISGDGAEGGS